MSELYIIDDFYQNPDQVRNFALSLNYENKSTPNYPGFQSEIPCLSESVIQKFEKIVGAKIDLESSRDKMGYFRYILEGGSSRLKVHTDMTDWTVVVYLASTFPNTKKVGTNLYQHKRTGLYGPPSGEGMKVLGYNDLKDFEEKVVVPDTLDDQAWDVVKTVPFKYNRCVVFKASKLFHSHANGFGFEAQDGRLTQNFFFNTQVFNV